jgi:hypothetical protein
MIIQNWKTDCNSIPDLSAGCKADLRRSEGWPIKKVIKTARCGELGHVGCLLFYAAGVLRQITKSAIGKWK